jgi:hypothetical protein
LFPFNDGKEGMENIGKSITKALSKPFNEIKKTGEKALNGIKGVVQKISTIGKYLGQVFVSIGSYFDCFGFYVGNIFSYCIIYYFMYILGLIIYAPFCFLFWITGTQYIENIIWDIFKTINEFIVDISGFDIMEYIFPPKCYKCNIKPMPKLKL